MIFVDYPGHLVAVLLAAAPAVPVLLAFRQGDLQNAKLRPYRTPLILLQYLSILILLLILWNPSRAKVSNTLSGNSVLAIFDTSESMSVIEDGQLTRLDKALCVFEDRFRDRDKGGAEYRIFGFDKQSYHSGSVEFLRRWGAKSDVHSVFSTMGKYDIEEESIESKVTGAVIFTDGRADDRNTDAYMPLRNRDLQIAFVGVGSREELVDIAITSLNAPARMAIDTACNVKVAVAARGLQDQYVTVELLRDDNLIDSRQIPRDAFTGNDLTVEFTIGAGRLGSHAFSARVKALEQEVNKSNNVRSAVIEVVEETRLKVLFYSQVANFNVGKVRQALAGNDKIQLDLSLDVIRKPSLAEKASKMTGYVELPQDRRGFYEYDIIVLGPCDLEALTGVQVDGLYSFVVERGGGLILLPGKVDFGPAAWINRKAKALVPVVLDPAEPMIWPAEAGEIELTLEGIDSGVLAPEALEDHDGQALPYYRISDSKPAATTLLTVADTAVVSIQRVGRGRVCLLNATKLFRWYREDLEGGLLSGIMEGLTAHMGKITSREAGIELFAERTAELPETVKFEAYVRDNSFDPVDGANVLLNLGDRVASMQHAGRGHYVAEIGNVKGQAIIATAQAEANGVFLGEKTIAANLSPARNEMSNVGLDEEFLWALAKKVNGKYFHIDDLADDAWQMFEARTGTVGSRQMTSIWPNWFLLAILCVLLSASWFVRRSIGLV